MGDIQYFSEPGQFEFFSAQNGKLPKGVEDFEEGLVDVGEKLPFPNSLQNGVPRPGFPNGINATNLIIQSNITPNPSPATTNPSANPNALWVNGPGFLGSNSIKVGTDEFLSGLFSSIDLIFTTNDKTAVGLDVSTYAGFNQGHAGFIITVYDPSDNILGTYAMPGMTVPEPNKSFFGVWSSTAIGRINVWGIFDVPQPFAVDNIQMWVPAPGAAGLLLIGGMSALRRRR
jgi:hypothetical protein